MLMIARSGVTRVSPTPDTMIWGGIADGPTGCCASAASDNASDATTGNHVRMKAFLQVRHDEVPRPRFSSRAVPHKLAATNRPAHQGARVTALAIARERGDVRSPEYCTSGGDCTWPRCVAGPGVQWRYII